MYSTIYKIGQITNTLTKNYTYQIIGFFDINGDFTLGLSGKSFFNTPHDPLLIISSVIGELASINLLYKMPNRTHLKTIEDNIENQRAVEKIDAAIIKKVKLSSRLHALYGIGIAASGAASMIGAHFGQQILGTDAVTRFEAGGIAIAAGIAYGYGDDAIKSLKTISPLKSITNHFHDSKSPFVRFIKKMGGNQLSAIGYSFFIFELGRMGFERHNIPIEAATLNFAIANLVLAFRYVTALKQQMAEETLPPHSTRELGYTVGPKKINRPHLT